MCGRVIFEDDFMLLYCTGSYKTQKICDEAVDSLEALKFIPDWFVTSKMLQKFKWITC